MGIIEGLLFAAGEALSIKEIASIIKEDIIETEKILSEMKDLFDYYRRGIQIKKIEDKYQLATRSEHYEYIKQIMVNKDRSGLSKAALETLAIIAYKQPVTRMEIESLRGVKSEGSIQRLLDRSLIKVTGRLNSPGKPMVYATTEEFLKYIGIESLDKLPDIDNLQIDKKSKENIEEQINIDEQIKSSSI
ncbi:MAG TPA: SMC-Scp complex subunit ScpB [Eubacteriaceae bacterium]|nr:SMC-Scp complex subunit ScpB [Eubacteriaceae bacterium]